MSSGGSQWLTGQSTPQARTGRATSLPFATRDSGGLRARVAQRYMILKRASTGITCHGQMDQRGSVSSKVQRASICGPIGTTPFATTSTTFPTADIGLQRRLAVGTAAAPGGRVRRCARFRGGHLRRVVGVLFALGGRGLAGAVTFHVHHRACLRIVVGVLLMVFGTLQANKLPMSFRRFEPPCTMP